MALTFKHATGYHGIAAIGSQPGETGKNNCKKILCTGGSITLNQDPISSTGVWGANSPSAAQIAYAYNYLRLEGQANYEVTSGIWETLKSFAIINKTNETGTYVVLRPDGTHGFAGFAWCNQISFECSEGAALTGSISLLGDPSGDNITTGEATDSFAANGFGETDASSLAGATLIPYYCTAASVGTTSGQEIISWNTSCNTDMQLLKLCKGETTVPLAADYIVCGEITCDGSISVFQLKGDFAPASYHKAKEAHFTYYEPSEQGNGDVLFGNQKEIFIPKVLYSSGSTSMTTGSSYIQADFNFTGYGNGKNAADSPENGIFIMREINNSGSNSGSGSNP